MTMTTQTMRKANSKQCEPQDDEEFNDFMDRCTGEGEDAEDCQLYWTESRSAKTKNNGDRKIVHKTHAEPVIDREFVLSDETQDRMGDIIVSTGWQLENFQKNPVALFNHNPNLPIGTWSDVHVKDGKLRGKLNLLAEGKVARIDEIRALIDAGILKAVSVGFAPLEYEAMKADDPFAGQRFKRQELVETSVVTVPANPNALAIAKSLKISDDTVKLVFAKPGSRDALEFDRRSTGKPAEMSPFTSKTMSVFAQRITDSQARIVALRDKLTEHLKAVDDSNVSDAELDVTNELNAKIRQEEKSLLALKDSEKNLLLAADDTNTHSNANGNGGVVVTTKTSQQMRPFGIKPKQVAPIEYLIRDGVVQIFSHRLKKNIEDVRRMIYGEDEATKAFIEYSAKAASAPAMTNVTGWAAELVTQINADFMEPLYAKAVYPVLASLGLALSFGRSGRIAVPTRSLTPTIAGSFVGEGLPIPVRQGAFTAAILTPKKMAVITSWTRELDEHSIPAIEGLLRDAIQHDTAVSIDNVLLDANPATAVRPAGLLNGIAGLTPTTGGGFNALVADLKALSGALMTSTNGNVRQMAWLMNPQQALSISLVSAPGTGVFPFKEEIGQGKLLGYTVIQAGTVPLGTVIVVDAADFVSVGGESPRFEISDQATLHMEDTTPLAIGTPGSPATVAAPVRSMFQTDSMALRLILPLNWTMRRPVVAWVAGVTW
jgi:HK97 family phage prohead protease/HK97 family phage major capsid protein